MLDGWKTTLTKSGMVERYEPITNPIPLARAAATQKEAIVPNEPPDQTSAPVREHARAPSRER